MNWRSNACASTEAEAQRALNDAINVLRDEQTASNLNPAPTIMLPAVIEKSVELMKSIDGIKIIQVDGLHRADAATSPLAALNGENLRRNKRYLPRSPIVPVHR